ncbi:MAG: deoxyribonuclease IV [Spirochaetales bacterium]|nr:deoxyribonuclease IV [Spirochaetales bacterium]
MKFIGAHVSIAGGLENGPANGKAIGADAIGIFTKNQRQWRSQELADEQIARFRESLRVNGILPENVLVHDSYLINLANPDGEKRQKSLEAFVDEAERVEKLGLTLLNFHPGATLGGCDVASGLSMVSDGINEALAQTSGVVAVIELIAGQGSGLGRSFDEVAQIIDRVSDKSRVGVCIDTCHIFAAGYDISTEEGYNAVMDEFDKVIGFKYLRGMHLNDSKGKAGSNLDRHDSLGHGQIGLEAFRMIMKDPRTDNIPLILETIRPELWPAEIELLRSFI